MPNPEPWSELSQFLLQQNSIKMTCKELSFAFAALANAIPEAYFAKLFAEKFSDKIGLDAESQRHFANYAAIMTGLTTFAINRASLLTTIQSSIDLFRQSLQHQYLDNKFLMAWGGLLVIALAGAIPGFQFAKDTSEDWPEVLAALLISIQLINFTASNMRPIIDSIGKKGFSKHNTDVVIPLRHELLQALNQQLNPLEQVARHDLDLLAEGILVRPTYVKTSKGLKFFSAVTAPAYALSYYFASQAALDAWNVYLRSLIGGISAIMKWLFMCYISFKLIEKVINAASHSSILAIVEEKHLPQWLFCLLGIISVFVGMTAALSSAGGLLKYLLPQVSFLDSPDTLMGLLEALGLALITNGPSKIFDIGEMLSNMVKQISCCLSSNETTLKLQLGQNKSQFLLRLMRVITGLSPSQFMLRFTVRDPETGLYVANTKYRDLLNLMLTPNGSNYAEWLHQTLHPERVDDIEIFPEGRGGRISMV